MVVVAGSCMVTPDVINSSSILFFITFVVLALSKWLLSRLQRNEGKRT